MAALEIVTHEDRYRLLLEISRIVNAPLELGDVTDAVATALQPLAAIDSMVMLTVENERVVSRSLHVTGVQRQEGDTFRDVAARALNLTPEQASRVALSKPLEGSSVQHAARTGRPFVSNGLTESTLRFEEDRKLISYGVKAYVLCPVVVRERLIGAVSFARRSQDFFEPEEVNLLSDISNIVGTALANALAYEEIKELRDRLQEENVLLREQIAEVIESDEMVGTSPAIRRVREAIEKVAGTDSTVLICGETGTGKELVARAIHRRSSRGRNSLVKVNCAALPQALIASELFGHERGAFTGATQRRIGRFEMAAGGSLFLDEVSEIPPDVQVALLRVLQEREFERVGGSQTIQTDVRLIAATNRELTKGMAEGTFRSDLYYRLNVFPIDVPPLRERREDIPLLVESFIVKFAPRIGKRVRGVEQKSMDLFLGYGWPGNIRELQNVVERAIILADDGILRVDSQALVQAEIAMGAATGNGGSDGKPFRGPLKERERDSVESALVQSRGRVSGPNGAAARLKLPASTLESKIRALGIDKNRFRLQTDALAKSFGE